jgi:co-chaperonin GroES (HSP10)
MKQPEAEKAIEKARKVYNNQPSMPAGYRLKVLSIPAEKGLEEAEAQQYQTLAAAGFQKSTEEQNKRETKGADRGILVEIGPGAWKGQHLIDHGDWAQVGQVVLYLRYSGKEEEEPKGSGIMYRFINDEDVLGYYEEKVL